MKFLGHKLTKSGHTEGGWVFVRVFEEVCHYRHEKCGLLDQKHFIWKKNVLSGLTKDALEMMILHCSDHPNEAIQLFHKYVQARNSN